MALRIGLKRYFFFFPAFFAAFALFVSCTDFFSNSLAPWAARDPNKLIPKVTVDNVDELLAKAENDPDMSLAILSGLRDAARGASGDQAAALQAAALEAASNAAGLGQSILGAAGKVVDIAQGDTEAAKGAVVDAINSMKNLNESASLLSDILPAPGDFPYDAPDSDFKKMTDAASADDLAMAALVLVAAEAKKQEADYDNYIDGIVERSESAELTENENLAKALALAATLEDRQDELSSSLRDALDGLNLFSKS